MKSPKEINNQTIIEENPMVNDEVIQDNYNSEDDYTWDDNKQHTEQCFFLKPRRNISIFPRRKF